MAKGKNVKFERFEKSLFKAADKLRKNMDAAEYKHVVLGLIFLKYISDSFETKSKQIETEYSNPKNKWYVKEEKARYEVIRETLNDKDEFIQANVFFVPENARWMNLAIRGIEGSQVKWNSAGSFLKDVHPDLKADFILANPPFNDSDWSGDLLRDDARWKYGVSPTGNANFAWLQHMIYHLSPKGIMACVLANGSLSSNTSGEGDIRKNLIEADLIDCIVALPKQLFYNTGIPACIWFISRKRIGNGNRKRENRVLFIDASNMGHLIDRTHRIFADEDMEKIANTYHAWRNHDNEYEDMKGFCKSASLEEIAKHHHVLTPGRYVGIPDEEDDFNFAERFSELKKEFERQIAEEAKLNKKILENLGRIEYEK